MKSAGIFVWRDKGRIFLWAIPFALLFTLRCYREFTRGELFISSLADICLITALISIWALVVSLTVRAALWVLYLANGKRRTLRDIAFGQFVARDYESFRAFEAQALWNLRKDFWKGPNSDR